MLVCVRRPRSIFDLDPPPSIPLEVEDSLKMKLARLGGWFLIILTIVAFLDGPLHSTTESVVVCTSTRIMPLTISTLAIILGCTLIKHR